MKKTILMFITLITIFNAYSQVIVKLGSITEAQSGTKVNIPLIVTGLDVATGGKALGAAEFHIKFQESNVVYDTTLNFAPVTTPTDWIFGSNTGEYGTTWIAPGLTGISIPDGTVLFEVVFDYQGGATILDLDSARCIFLDTNLEQFTINRVIDATITPGIGSDLSVWNGNGEWNTAGNWSNGVPGSNSSATIETGTVQIISNANSKSLTVNAASTIKVIPGASLTVDEGFINNGSFIIESDTSGTGSVIVNGTLSGTGTYITKQYIEFTGSENHLVSSPLPTTNVSVFSGFSPQKFNETTSAWQNAIAGEIIPTGKGLKLTSNTPDTLVFNGSFNSGNVTVTGLEYTAANDAELRGLNLIGNPFTSSIKADLASWDKSSVGNGVYVWNGFNYLCWNGILGSLPNGAIPAMQGFFIRAENSGSALNIPTNAKMHNTAPYFKEGEDLLNTLLIRFEKESDPDHFDEAFIHIKAGATNGYDASNDVLNLSGNPLYPQVYTLSADVNKLAINTQPEFTSIPVVFKTNGSGAYRISVSGINSFDSNLPIFLEDKLVPANNINIRDMQSFLFTFDDGTTANDRYFLHFSTIGINELPSECFKVWANNGYIHIESDQQKNIEGIELLSITGSVLYKSGEFETPSSIRLTDKADGIVILRIRTKDGVFTKKILNLN